MKRDLAMPDAGRNIMGQTVWTMTETHMEEDVDWEAWRALPEMERYKHLFGGKLPSRMVLKTTTSKPFVF